MVEVQYTDLLEFISYSESNYDFVERLSISSAVVIAELSNRIMGTQIPFKLIPIIDEMNEEINSLVANLNSLDLVMNQPELQENLLLRLIEQCNPKLYEDYYNAKYVLMN
jgi:hypothetical protein